MFHKPTSKTNNTKIITDFKGRKNNILVCKQKHMGLSGTVRSILMTISAIYSAEYETYCTYNTIQNKI